jgi:hypothetical protein
MTKWVLSLDQASKKAGAALWKDGVLVGVAALDGGPTAIYSRRLIRLQEELTGFLKLHLGPADKVSTVVFEGVHARLVMITVGAFLCCPLIDAKMHAKFSFIESSGWKKWAQNHGASGPFKDIKGVKALMETGFPVGAWPTMTEDVADAVMIGMTWKERASL